MCRRLLSWKYFGWIFIFLLWEFGQASSKSPIFKAYHWSPVTRDFTEEITVTKKGNDVQLRCTVSDAVTPQSLTIRRLDQENIQFPNKTYDRSTHSLSVTLIDVSCNEQGTYVCEHGTQKEMLDLGITDCEPKLCRNETNPKVVYAEINKTKLFFLCIVAETKNKLLFINNVMVRENETNNKWIWKSTYKEFDNFRNYLNFTVRNVSKNDYKTYDITLTSQTSQTNMEEKFRIELKEPVEPKCPTNISVAHRSTYSVTLSWQPGDPGADRQWYSVNYTCQTCWGWKNETTTEQTNSITISNLDKDKIYNVRVNPHNNAGLTTACEKNFTFDTVGTSAAPTTKSTTSTTFAAATAPPAQVPATTPTPKDKKSDSTDDTITSILPIIIILGVLAILAVPVAILGICMYCRLKRVYSNLWNPEISRSRRNVRYIPEGSLQTTPTEPVNESLLSNQSSDNRSGRSVSQDGLIYITVDHSSHHGRPKTNSSTRKGDKVEYAGLDYKYSGRLPMSCSDDTYVNC